MKSREKPEPTIEEQLAELPRLKLTELCRRYRTVVGQEPRSTHRQHVARELAWHIQAQAEGGLPAHVRQYALALGRNSALRVRISANAARRRKGETLDNAATTHIAPAHDPRLPLPGSLLIKDYRGQTYVVKTLDEGFEFGGRRYGSLSAIAQQITGTKWNGFLFFGLTKEARIAQ